MTFLSILFALLIEQLRPLRADNPMYTWIKFFAVRIENWFNAGHAHHGRLGWLVMVAALTVPAGVIYWVCLCISPLAALTWNVLVVYMTLGFRHYSNYFTSIQLALNTGDEVAARALLAEWTRRRTSPAWMSVKSLVLPPNRHCSRRTVTYSAYFSGS